MSKLRERCSLVLTDAGFHLKSLEIGKRVVLAFEDATVLGFLVEYESAENLISNWSADCDRIVSAFQFGLRRAGKKAWNAYMVIVTEGNADFAQAVTISSIEEDLTGTRKIARAGVQSPEDAAAALLPLLPLANVPRLDAVDMLQEIRARTTELPSICVDAFLSGADDAVVLQVLEEAK